MYTGVCAIAEQLASIRLNYCNTDYLSRTAEGIFIQIQLCQLLWPPCVADADIIFSSCGTFLSSSSFFFFFLPNPSGRRLDVYHTSTHRVAFSANLECMSEKCCTRLAENAGRKKSPKIGHLRTIAQVCRAISSH